MARSKNKPAPIESSDPLEAKVTSNGGRRFSLKKIALYSLFACGACWMLTILFPTKPKDDGLPTAADIPTQAALVVTEAGSATVEATALSQRDIDQTATAIILQPTMTALDAMVKASQTAKAMPSATLTNTPVPVAQAVVVPTSALLPFDEATYTVKIMDTLFIGAGGRDIGTVRVANGRPNGGEIVVIVPYDTTETSPEAQVDEIVDIFQSVGVGISSNKLDVDSVTLITGVKGIAALATTGKAADVVAVGMGRMTTPDFLKTLDMQDMTGGSSISTSQQVTVSNQRSETRMIQSQANLRPCPRRTEDCASIVTLERGATINVIGDVQGDTVSGSTLWYVGVYQGKTVYVHSSLVAAPGVTSLPSAPVAQPTSGVIVVGNQNQSVVPVQSNAPAQVWNCVGNIYNCSDFTGNRAGLDAYWAACPGDPSDLDGNPSDGYPCNSLR